MTAIEIIIVMVLIGIMTSVAFPFIRGAVTKAGVSGAMSAITSLHGVARNAAILRGRTSVLVLRGSAGQAMVVSKRTGSSAVDTIGRVEDLYARFGVGLSTTADSIIFTPRGIGAGTSNITVIVSRAGYADTLVISAAGRLLR